jgi:tRNA(Arg) A34 adenosine deaminase TadA
VGGPFAALIVRDDKVIAEGTNTVTSTNDPTAHAEVNAIRTACAILRKFDLTGCDLYASCEPCPMCLSACYWSRMSRIFYAATREDATAAGFDDAAIYQELTKDPADRRLSMAALDHSEAVRPFQAWRKCTVRREY